MIMENTDKQIGTYRFRRKIKFQKNEITQGVSKEIRGDEWKHQGSLK